MSVEADTVVGYFLQYTASLFWQCVLSVRVAIGRGFDVIHTKDRKIHCVDVARRESKRSGMPAAIPDIGGKRLCINRKRSGFEVTWARSLFGDMKSAVFGVAWPSAGLISRLSGNVRNYVCEPIHVSVTTQRLSETLTTASSTKCAKSSSGGQSRNSGCNNNG